MARLDGENGPGHRGRTTGVCSRLYWMLLLRLPILLPTGGLRHQHHLKLMVRLDPTNQRMVRVVAVLE